MAPIESALGPAKRPRCTPELLTKAPLMPAVIDAIIHEDWDKLDPDGNKMLDWIRKQRVFHEFAHAEKPFATHLRNTWAVLCAWGQPQDISRAGLFHSAYSGQVFYFRFFDITSDEDGRGRALLRSVVGTAAEQNVYNFCSTHRQDAMPLSDYGDVNAYSKTIKPLLVMGDPLCPDGYTLPCRQNPEHMEHLSPGEVAKILIILVADVAEQLTSVFTYLDIYQPFETPSKVWPGDGPGLGYAVFSRMCKTAAPYLDVKPPIFDYCTSVLTHEAELQARDAYWKVVRQEDGLDVKTRLELLSLAIKSNPFIAEPHVHISQLYFNQGEYQLAVHHAARGLKHFYDWGTCWDKRMGYEQWVGFTRMALMRAFRKAEGKVEAIPCKPLTDTAVNAACRVTYLQDIVAEFQRTTEVDGGTQRSSGVEQ